MDDLEPSDPREPLDAAQSQGASATPAFQSFTLRVAAHWVALPEASSADAEFFYRKQAPLTGPLATTNAGQDVTFSDLTV